MQRELAQVFETSKTLKKEKIHLETTNLIILTYNDDMSVVREMGIWVKKE